MLKIYQVDAFTSIIFGGNPAAVVILEHWIDDHVLRSIAAENNLAETAYLVPVNDDWELRWFTPTAEVALCGHATLAAAHVLVTHMGCTDAVLKFRTRESGTLTVESLSDGAFAMSFPAVSVSSYGEPHLIEAALNAKPTQVLYGNYSADQLDILAVFDSETDVAALEPDLSRFKVLDSRGIIATAKGTSCDFVSRYFAPNFGIDEDPVTGSAHCLLAPYWSNVLDKQKTDARQISQRGGKIQCTLNQDRVVLTGYAVSYLVGSLFI